MEVLRSNKGGPRPTRALNHANWMPQHNPRHVHVSCELSHKEAIEARIPRRNEISRRLNLFSLQRRDADA